MFVHGLLDPVLDIDGLSLPHVQGDGQSLDLSIKVVRLHALQGEGVDPGAVELGSTLCHVLDHLDRVLPHLIRVAHQCFVQTHSVHVVTVEMASL